MCWRRHGRGKRSRALEGVARHKDSWWLGGRSPSKEIAVRQDLKAAFVRRA